MLRWAGRPQTRPGGEVLRRSCSNERPIDLRKVRSSMIREPNVASNVIDAVWRIESTRVIAGVARVVRRVGLAEDLAQDALVAALEQWPDSGVPENPGAWLMAVAKRRAIDALRRRTLLERKQAELGRALGTAQQSVVRRWIPPWATTSATTCCASCSSPVTRCSPRRPASPCRSACSAV